MHTHLPPDDLLLVDLDYLEIDQVLTNLLENAVRYTPAGSPIEVSAHDEGEQVEISVADRGPGIPAADLERVFDKFYRVLHGQHPAGYPMGIGTGIGRLQGPGRGPWRAHLGGTARGWRADRLRGVASSERERIGA